ncbi:MAG: hypothetical protein ACLU9S_01615 [Oscillospiraceae bacterium]
MIAEKPSVAKSLAAVLGAGLARKDGYLEGERLAGELVPGASGRAGGRRRLQPRLRQVAL